MLGVTIFGVFFTPVFYYVIRWITTRRTTPKSEGMPTASASATEPGHATATATPVA
jgi:hypothetical protein